MSSWRAWRRSTWRSDSSFSRASPSASWATGRRKRRRPSPLARRSRCFMLSFARTGRRSIRVRGGSKPDIQEGSRIMRKTSLVLLGASWARRLCRSGPRTQCWSAGGSRWRPRPTSIATSTCSATSSRRSAPTMSRSPTTRRWSRRPIYGMLASLDPHSSYMDAKSFRDMQVQTRGEFGGLGIEVMQEDGLVKVVAPIDDTPASRAGVLSGDLIIAIDGENVQGMTLNQAVDKMRGAVNTNVKLTIVRGAEEGQDRRQRSPAPSSRSSRCARMSKAPTSATSASPSSPSRPIDGLKEAMEKFQTGHSGRQVQGLHPRPAQQSRAACSTSRWRWSTPSSTTARSSRRAAATPTRPSATTPARSTSPRASRWSC